jgi:hypothetical protein
MKDGRDGLNPAFARAKNSKQNHAITVLRVIFAAILMSGFAVDISDAKPRPTPAPTPSGKTARLIVQRAPNFGSDLFIRLSIDGTRVGNIQRNQHYGGFVSVGRHTVTALALPNTEARRPTSLRLDAKAGQVYIFTATWDSDRLVLAPSTYYTPTTRVGEVRKKKSKFWFW